MGAALLERHEPGVIPIGCIADLGGGEHLQAGDLDGLPASFLDENRTPREALVSLVVVLHDRQLPSDAPAGALSRSKQ
jgi:hypothetical protein